MRVEAGATRRRAAAFAVVAIGAAIAAAIYLASSRKNAVDDTRVVTESADPPLASSYTGSDTCGGCHADQFRAWQTSQHALAMQVASDGTVLGDFSDARFQYRGVTSKFFRRDGAFFVRTDGSDGRLADFEVRYTFGIYPLQQYLIERPGGRLQALSIAWDARPVESGGQRWFHLYPTEAIYHRDELHWTGRQQNWNYMCADCHSTNLQKNYDPVTNSYATSWSEISVGCEGCHGPGSAHVRLAAEGRGSAGLTVALDERKDATWNIDAGTGNARRDPPRTTSRELGVCAQCHARRGQFSNEYRPGESFLDHYRPALLERGLYHADGQQLDEVYVWGSFLSSRMHDAGVTCSDCHEPHTGRLRAADDALCSQCHQAAKYQATSHHLHSPGSPGSRCVACHMTSETYMGVDGRHDHSFRIPRPDLTATIGVPNACARCHESQTAEWAAAAVRQHHPSPKPGYQAFATAFAAAERGAPGAAAALANIVRDRSQSAIARATALDRLAARPDGHTAAVAQANLADPSALVRAAALAALEHLPPLERRAALPLLADQVRTVRLAAAVTLAPLAVDALGDHAAAFERAAAEYMAAERFNADRPENRTNLGNFLADRGELTAAEAEYRAALALDRRFVPASVNLAELQRSHGREHEAEATLRKALAEVPGSADLHHVLGLSLVRQQRPQEALRELAAAAGAAPGNARYAYVHAVALHAAGQKRAALGILERAHSAAPADRDILEALVLYYSEIGDRLQAARAAEKLRNLESGGVPP